MTKPTTLYRFYGSDGALLYVGIAGNPGRRFRQHEKRDFWGDVVGSTMERFPTREEALKAEAHAIRTEHPRYNVVHNRSAPIRDQQSPHSPIHVPDGPVWSFRFKGGSGYEHHARLWLSYEPLLIPTVDDVDGTPAEKISEWVRALKSSRHYYEEEGVWKRSLAHAREGVITLLDGIPITWFVEGDDGTFETSPHCPGSPFRKYPRDFETFFTTPEAVGHEFSWHTLPVHLSRWPEIETALGYKPVAHQPSMPLAAILRGYQGDLY